MNKRLSKISVAVVCVIFGFLLSYQIKVLHINKMQSGTKKQNAEISLEIEQLQKQKEELKKKIDSLQSKIAQYEQAAASKDERSKMLLEDLKKMRILNGATKVKGEGLIIRISPKSNIFGSAYEGQPITDSNLLAIVNELYSVGAEAISINGIRITARSGIRTASNSIIISNEKISYNKPVEIKAIGNKDLLEAALNFPGNIPNTLYQNCDIDWKSYDEIIIPKSNELVEFKYAVPLEK